MRGRDVPHRAAQTAALEHARRISGRRAARTDRGVAWAGQCVGEGSAGGRRLEKVKQLAKVADDLGVTLPKLALAWCLKNPNVSTVITGASKPEQVRENMKAGEVVDQLDDGVMKRIESVLQGG